MATQPNPIPALRPSWAHATSVEVRFRRPDGTDGSCVVAETAPGTMIDYYATLGYVTLSAVAFASCLACDGRGHRPHKRNALRRVTCSACLGEGQRAFA